MLKVSICMENYGTDEYAFAYTDKYVVYDVINAMIYMYSQSLLGSLCSNCWEQFFPNLLRLFSTFHLEYEPWYFLDDSF